MVQPSGPDQIIVIGGGRWAHVMVGVLLNIAPEGASIVVRSPRNASGMAAWLAGRKAADHVRVTEDWPQLVEGRSAAVIVVNAAKDHVPTIEWALEHGAAVLSEKPVALSEAALLALTALAREKQASFYAANVFLFARYVEALSQALAQAGPAREVRIRFEDPVAEWRHGENKRFDPALPVFMDWMPHCVSILGFMLGSQQGECTDVAVYKGGAHVEVTLRWAGVPCSLTMIRNGETRRRVVELDTDKGPLSLDFSSEPGVLRRGGEAMVADPLWDSAERPLARMLGVFLGRVGDDMDTPLRARLDIGIALAACRISDQVKARYRQALTPWLAEKLTAGAADADLQYALNELAMSEALILRD